MVHISAFWFSENFISLLPSSDAMVEQAPNSSQPAISAMGGFASLHRARGTSNTEQQPQCRQTAKWASTAPFAIYLRVP
jgi:hypothetical protein